MSGGANEILSFLYLLIFLCLYKQREVTQQEIKQKIKKFEEQLAKKEAKEAEKKKLEIANKIIQKPMFDDSSDTDEDLKKNKKKIVINK